MTPSTDRNVLIVGNGPHAREYAKVFREGLGYRFSVSGPREGEIEKFRLNEAAHRSIPLDRLTEDDIAAFDFVVSATSPDSLETVTSRLLALGAKAILVEKPIALSAAGLERVSGLARERSAFCRAGYNRRYYRSVRALKTILCDEPPVQAFFDFTELSRQVKSPTRSVLTTERWALVNSCHVFDTVCFLLGDYAPAHTYCAGADALDWHPVSSHFAGSGLCGTTPVSYATNWQCPGRWNVEILTQNGRYKLSPLERLQVMRHDSFAWHEIDAGYDIDIKFKPGLHDMVLAFDAARTAASDGARAGLCDLPTLEENEHLAATISRLVGY